MISSVGFSNPLFFMGIVEDVSQNNALPGRVRVRAFGVHPPAQVGNAASEGFLSSGDDNVPTDALPWAPVINGSGGAVSKMPEKSEWVFGMFLDGRDAQHPIVLGTFPGIKGTLPMNSGTIYDNYYEMASSEAIEKFAQPVGGVASEWAGIPSAPEVAAMSLHNAEGVDTGDGSRMIELSPVGGLGRPDKLAVIKPSTNGSNIQVGGDGDAEHIALYHTTGAHMQIDDNGNAKISSPETVQTWANKNIQQRADGSFDISAGENMTIRVDGGKATIYAAGDVNIVSRNNINMTASGKINMNAGEGIDIRGMRIGLHAIDDNIDIVSAQKIKMQSGADMSINSSANMFLKSSELHSTSDTLKLSASGEIHLKAVKVALDDLVDLATGTATAATVSSDQAVVSSMDAPEGREVVSEVSRRGTTSGYNMHDIDDGGAPVVDAGVDFNGEGFQKGIDVYCKLQGQGYSRAAAAAIVGNVLHESGQFTFDEELGSRIGRGWLQWSYSRRDNFESWSSANGLNPSSDTANYNFMLYELDGGTGNQWTGGASTGEFAGLTDTAQATKYFMDNYERPNESVAYLNRRVAFAEAIYDSECPV